MSLCLNLNAQTHGTGDQHNTVATVAVQGILSDSHKNLARDLSVCLCLSVRPSVSCLFTPEYIRYPRCGGYNNPTVVRDLSVSVRPSVSLRLSVCP